jgi:conjugative transfer signal peptidase TraF
MRLRQSIVRLVPGRVAPGGVTIAALVVATLGMAGLCGIRVNATPSMPRGLWQVRAVTAPVRRGELVTVCLPDTAPVREAAARGYLPAGICAGGYEPLVKPVAAVAGDRVAVTPRGVTVDGRLVAHTAPLAQDSAGRPLQSIPAGVYPVMPGEIWLLSGHNPRSFDSRYFGPVPVADVQAVARPLWVFG